jgi:hypothetical protein
MNYSLVLIFSALVFIVLIIFAVKVTMSNNQAKISKKLYDAYFKSIEREANYNKRT